MLPSRLLPAFAVSVLAVALPVRSADPEDPANDSTSLAALRFDEQFAIARRVHFERLQNLDERLLSRLDEEADRPALYSNLSLTAKGESQLEVTLTESLAFVRIVETQSLAPPSDEMDRFRTRLPTGRRIVRLSQPVLSFEEAIEAGDIHRAWTFPRLEIDFEFLPKRPVLNTFPETLIAGSRAEEASAKVHSVFPYSLGLGR